MIASLPMYDLPWLREVTDRYWALIRDGLDDAPALARERDLWDTWESPRLLLSQTCGLPMRMGLMDRVQMICVPVHDLTDCPAGRYFSWFIRRRGDARDMGVLARGVFAANQAHSQSGWGAPVSTMAERGVRPAQVVETGAHLASIAAVLEGTADFAAIDAVTYRLWSREHPDLAAGLDRFDRTSTSPALPYITAQADLVPSLRAAIGQAVERLGPEGRDALSLHGTVQLPGAAYADLPLAPACQGAAIPG